MTLPLLYEKFARQNTRTALFRQRWPRGNQPTRQAIEIACPLVTEDVV